MPLVYTTRSIFDLAFTKAEILVNPVNCVGVMGKGLALQFKNNFPHCLPAYKRHCENGWLYLGHPTFTSVKIDETIPGSYKPVVGICFFPTKHHWKDNSSIYDIDKGLLEFNYLVSRDYQEAVVSFPKLGCGLGGLDWKTQVQPLMKRYLDSLPNRVYIHVEKDSEFP